MAINLVISSTWHELVKDYANRISNNPLGIFDFDTVIMSSSSIRNQLSQTLSENTYGICAGINFITLPSLTTKLLIKYELLDPKYDPWNQHNLTISIFKLLQDQVNEPELSPVINYLKDHNNPEYPARWISTAHSIAKLYTSYFKETPKIIQSWNNEKPLDLESTSLPPDKIWQFKLWQGLKTQATSLDPVARIEKLCDKLSEGNDFPRLFFFDPPPFNELQRKMVKALAKKTEITVYRVERPNINNIFPRFTLSENAQQKFWHNLKSNSTVVASPTTKLAPLALHGSHGKKRQVEVLREVLCNLFELNPSLEPRDVVVFCPDLNSYSSLIHAYFDPSQSKDIFSSHPGKNLRAQICGHPKLNQITEQLIQLLKLPMSRATSSDFVDLCRSKPIRNRFEFSENDLEIITELITKSNIRWGIDTTHRKNFELSDIWQNTWAAGLDQLLIGLAMRPEELHGLGRVFPVTTDSNVASLAGRLCELVGRIRRLLHNFENPTNLINWAKRLHETIDWLFSLPLEEDWMIHEVRNKLNEFQNITETNINLTRNEVRYILQSWGPSKPRTRFGNGSLTFCDFGQLRNITHKVVCLLGISDSNYPGKDFSLPDSLNISNDTLTSKRVTNKQILVDTLASAKDQIVIIYQAKSDLDNRSLPMPVILEDLITSLKKSDVQIVQKTHPLQPFSTENFANTTSAAFSFDTQAVKAANALQSKIFTQNNKLQLRERLMDLEPICEETVSVEQLITFFKNPIRSLNRRRGLYILADQELNNSLPIELSGLQKWQIGSRILDLLRQGHDLYTISKAEFIRGELPPGALGANLLDEIKFCANKIFETESKFTGPKQIYEIDLNLGDTKLTGRQMLTGRDLILADYSKLGPKNMLAAWIWLLALSASNTAIESAQIIGRNTTKNVLPACTALTVIDPTIATKILSEMLLVYRSGTNSAVPLPLDMAYEYASRAKYPSFNPTTAAQDKKIANKFFWDKENWIPYYLEPKDFFIDPPLPTDPKVSGEKTRFGTLALWLFHPLQDAIRTAKNV